MRKDVRSDEKRQIITIESRIRFFIKQAFSVQEVTDGRKARRNKDSEIISSNMVTIITVKSWLTEFLPVTAKIPT